MEVLKVQANQSWLLGEQNLYHMVELQHGPLAWPTVDQHRPLSLSITVRVLEGQVAMLAKEEGMLLQDVEREMSL
jgi:hypothetical protein